MLIIAAAIVFAVLRQISVVAFTPWANDFDHWFSALFVTVVCGFPPLSLAWRRWRDEPDRFREFRRSIAAGWAVKSRWSTLAALWVGIAVALAVVYNVRPH